MTALMLVGLVIAVGCFIWALELLDATGDGMGDTFLLDPNQDGLVDGRAYDTTGDGAIDTVTTVDLGDAQNDEAGQSEQADRIRVTLSHR